MVTIKHIATLMFFLIHVPLSYTMSGGGSGIYFQIPDSSSGVKIFKNNTQDDSGLEFAVWQKVRDNYHNFKNLNLEHIPAWWKQSKDFKPVADPVHPRSLMDSEINLMLKILDALEQKKEPEKKVSFSSQKDEIIYEKIAQKLKELAQEKPNDFTEKNNFLLMENINQKIQFQSKSINIFHHEKNDEWNNFFNKIIIQDQVEYLKIGITKRLGEAFLLMFLLGITIEDCDLFVQYLGGNKGNTVNEVLNNITIKFIDFGESLVFGDVTNAGVISFYSIDEIKQKIAQKDANDPTYLYYLKAKNTFGFKITSQLYQDSALEKIKTFMQIFEPEVKEHIWDVYQKTKQVLKTNEASKPYEDALQEALDVKTLSSQRLVKKLDTLKERLRELKNKLGTLNLQLNNLRNQLSVKLVEKTHPNYGITNSGSDCFMASLLQVLSNTQILDPLLKQDFFSPNSIPGKLILFMNDLRNAGAALPLEKIKTLRAYITSHADNPDVQNMAHGHQDASELLSYLFETFEKINEQAKKFITTTFHVKIHKKSTCQECKTSDVSPDVSIFPFSFSIPEPSQKVEKISLMDSVGSENEQIIGSENEQNLINYFVPDPREAHCSKCNKNRDKIAEKSYAILPSILVLNPKRFTSDGQKNNLPISFPFTLTLKDDSGNVNYDLIGFVCHGGGVKAGHYWSYCKDSQDQKWRCYNGALVSEKDPNDMKEIADQKEEIGSPYIFFYKRT